jgi:hypothetical protein
MDKPLFTVRPRPKPRTAPVERPSFPTVEALVANALDFLNNATNDLETRPKQSVIAFYTAVELFLKARLMHEHWTLVVTRDADRDRFQQGDFISVSFEDACRRLDKVVGSPLSRSTYEAFDRVRKHRNKMVHFYHQGALDEKGLEEIALEQLSAWLALRDLITAQWREAFKPAALNLFRINQQFSRHRQYFCAKFHRVQDHIAQLAGAGERIEACPTCEFAACQVSEGPESVFTSHCHVCSAYRGWIEGPCPKCGSTMQAGGLDPICMDCFHVFKASELAEQWDEQLTPTPPGRTAPGNCAECHGESTVIDWKNCYVCVECTETFRELHECEWCGEHSTEDMTGFYIKGCSNWGGAVGMT